MEASGAEVMVGRGPETNSASEFVGMAAVVSMVALTVTTNASAVNAMPKMECIMANE